MSPLPAQKIRRLCELPPRLVHPFCERTVLYGMTYGLSGSGYDIRAGQDKLIFPCWLPGSFRLLSSLEHFNIPIDLKFEVKDKSTLARKGLAVQNTVGEPGWSGWLTIEVTNHSWWFKRIRMGQPIAQIVFDRLEEPTEQPYEGKYQNQGSEPQKALVEK